MYLGAPYTFSIKFALLIKKEKRNNRSFEDRERTWVELKALFFKTLFHWVGF
jgi:hypothetical protein